MISRLVPRARKRSASLHERQKKGAADDICEVLAGVQTGGPHRVADKLWISGNALLRMILEADKVWTATKQPHR